jgi:hypothetical protein
MPAIFEYFPFDNQQSSEAQWRDMMETMRTTGIIVQGSIMDSTAGDCAVSPGTGLQIKIATGKAWIKGHMFKHSSDYHYMPIASNNSGSSRTDLVVLRLDTVNNTISYQILQGTTTPVQNSTTWDLPLAEVTVANGASSISSSDIKDRRVTSTQIGLTPAVIMTNSISRNVGAGATVTLVWDIDKFDPTAMHDETGAQTDRLNIKESGIYLVHAMLFWKHPSSQNINGTLNFSIYRNRGGNVDQIARDTTYIAATQGVQSCMKVVDCQAGDFLYVQATNNASAPLDIDAATPYSPYFSAVKLGTTSGF